MCVARGEIPNLLFNHHVEHARLCFTQHLPRATHKSPARKGSQTKAKDKAMNISNENQGLSYFRKAFASQIEQGRQARIKGFIGQPYMFGQDDPRYREAWLTGYFEGKD